MKKILSLVLMLFLVGVNVVQAVENTFSPGGTDYFIYDVGDGIKYPNQMKLEYLESMKSVIGSYDLRPDIVKSQLQTMCNVGQRKISLIVYFLPFPNWLSVKDGVYISDLLPIVNSAGGKLSPRHEKNVREVVLLIATLKTVQNTPCFDELQFRFAPMGEAQPLGWATWNETQYQENWNFIYSTHNLIKSAIGMTPLVVYFDLGAEQGGQVVGPSGGLQNDPYLKRLFADYNSQFGVEDTYGFSFVPVPGRFQKLIGTYDAAGVRPAQHAADIYGDPNSNNLESLVVGVFNEMKQTGEQNKPLIIQETFYNDTQAFDKFIALRNQLGIKIRTVMQWQMASGSLHTWNIGNSYPHMTLTVVSGDFDNNNVVNLADFGFWKSKYLAGQMTLAEFVQWKMAYLVN